MFDHSVIAFTLAAGVLTLVPGADTMLVMRNVLGRGRSAGFLTTLGIGSGLLVQALLSGLGLSAILLRSAQLYSAVKLAGALYLTALGVWTLIRAWNSRANGSSTPASRTTSSPGNGGVRQAYFEGLLTNVLNPKVAVFYLAFLPQFIGPADPVLLKSILLAAVHFALTILWLSSLTVALTEFSGWMSRPAIRRRLRYFTGGVLASLGLCLAFERS